jgi:two-component system, sensor histidine kinase and response regulator
MGPSGTDQQTSRSDVALTDITNRSLFATATLLAVVALFACWFGTREIINGIINFEGRDAATRWAEAFAHTLGDRTGNASGPLAPYSSVVAPAKFTALDNAIFDGKIIGYRIYDPKGLIVASSNFMEIGSSTESPDMRRAIERGETLSHLATADTADTADIVSKAIAPLIWAGNLKGAIQVDVDLSARAAQLNRLRHLAFGALAGLLAAVMAILGHVVARTLRRHKSASRELTRNIRQHRRLLDEAPDSMVIHNMKRVLYANTAAAALHGAASPDDLIGLDPAVLVPDDKNGLVRQHRQKALREGKVMRTESVGRRRLDGSVVETDSLGIPIEWNGEQCILIQSRDMSERHVHQRKIAEREAQLSAFMEHSQSMMFIKDLDNRMVIANRRHEEFHGVKIEDVVGKTCEAWVRPDIANQFIQHDRQVIESRTPSSLEMVVPRPDGELRNMKEEKFPILDANGEIVGLGCVSTDITEIKDREKISRRAQAEAQRAQAQLSAFLDHSPSGMYLKDRDLKVTMVNRAYEKFYGFAPDELVGYSVDKWLPKNVADDVNTLDLEILRRGEMLDVEAEVPNAEGDTRTLIFSKFPIYAANGDIVGVGGINTDVTESRRHEEARLSAYIDHIPMIVMLVDRDSRILMVNSQYEKFFGVRATEMIGKCSIVGFEGEQLERFKEENRQICDNLETSERVLPRSNAAGEERLLHQIKFPIVTGGNVPVVMGVVLTDITEQKKHENELEAARDVAEAANHAKSAFLANMSHEIRTPMNGVFGMADLLAQSALTTDQQRYLNTIRRSGEALLGVINNVLDISRIEAGEFRLDTSTFNIHDLVAEAMELFVEAASEKKVFIAHNISGNVPRWVQDDSVRLRQVLINLIGNAIKFTKDGVVIVRATRIGGTDGDALIRFEVTDTGIGIEREKLVSLFDPFQQADTSVTRRFGGTGLGLSIADHIVKLMGGRIDIDSRPGDGSSFVFSISLAIDATKASTYREAGGNLSGKRMLIVDDNAVNREILSEFAHRWNADFVAAASAVEAQAAIREAAHTGQSFDVALIDIVMPHMNGIALAEWIGGQDLAVRTKLIALTSFNWDRDNVTFKAAGFLKFSTKPIRRAELAQLIEELLADSSFVDTDDHDRRVPSETPSELSDYSARILLAEDNPVNLELAQEYLTRLGCTVAIADDGQKAIDLLSEQDFDLILMDVQMPEVDGIEATRQIRDLEARNGSHRIPIIAATAHAFQEDREKCILAGMDDFLSKPYTGKDIAPILDRWLAPSDTTRNDSPAPSASRNEADSITPATSGLLDGDTIAQLRALDETGENLIFGKVVGIFMDNTPVQLRQLQKHIAAKDFAGITLVAHSLKASAANVSALSLSSLLRDIEIAAGKKDLQTCAKTTDEVMALYEDVSAALRIATSGEMPNRKSA